MSRPIWTINLLVFADSPIPFAAHVLHFAAVAISAQHFLRLLKAFQDAQISLIRLCNMCGYTHVPVLSPFFAYTACFVGDAVFRAGDGCFGLAVQDYYAVQVGCASPNFDFRT